MLQSPWGTVPQSFHQIQIAGCVMISAGISYLQRYIECKIGDETEMVGAHLENIGDETEAVGTHVQNAEYMGGMGGGVHIHDVHGSLNSQRTKILLECIKVIIQHCTYR